MEKLTSAEQKIADFIYDYPEVVVKVLNTHGYNISMDTATLPEINELTYKALIIDNNAEFADSFDNAIANDGYSNIIPLVVTIGLSVASSLFGASSASKQADKNRALQKNIALAGMAQNEKLAMEKIRTESETERTKILANTLLAYRDTLQKESTIRLKDTWLYVTGLGIGIGIIYGIYLLAD
jgi:hypothetical protein